jgi:hypothetical protein
MMLLLWRLNALGFEIRRARIFSFQPKDLVQRPLKLARKNRRCWPEYQQQQPNNKIFLFFFFTCWMDQKKIRKWEEAAGCNTIFTASFKLKKLRPSPKTFPANIGNLIS